MKMRTGDPVVYLADRALYGEMEIVNVRKDKMLECLINPDDPKRCAVELFSPHEVDVPVPEAA